MIDARTKSSELFLSGDVLVTILKSSKVSVFMSKSCSSSPFRQVRLWILSFGIFFNLIKILFFFDFNIFNASSSKSGAINISKNNSLIWFAVSSSIILFVVRIPPKADMLSQAKESLYASIKESLIATPHGLLCLCIKKIALSDTKSLNKFIEESISSKLLYDMSLPLICSKHSSKSPINLAFWWGFSPYRNSLLISFPFKYENIFES